MALLSYNCGTTKDQTRRRINQYYWHFCAAMTEISFFFGLESLVRKNVVFVGFQELLVAYDIPSTFFNLISYFATTTNNPLGLAGLFLIHYPKTVSLKILAFLSGCFCGHIIRSYLYWEFNMMMQVFQGARLHAGR